MRLHPLATVCLNSISPLLSFVSATILVVLFTVRYSLRTGNCVLLSAPRMSPSALGIAGHRGGAPLVTLSVIATGRSAFSLARVMDLQLADEDCGSLLGFRVWALP